MLTCLSFLSWVAFLDYLDPSLPPAITIYTDTPRQSPLTPSFLMWTLSLHTFPMWRIWSLDGRKIVPNPNFDWERFYFPPPFGEEAFTLPHDYQWTCSSASTISPPLDSSRQKVYIFSVLHTSDNMWDTF